METILYSVLDRLSWLLLFLEYQQNYFFGMEIILIKNGNLGKVENKCNFVDISLSNNLNIDHVW